LWKIALVQLICYSHLYIVEIIFNKNMRLKSNIVKVSLGTMIAFGLVAAVAQADHSWGNYHWGRNANPFTLKLGDNVSSIWDPYLVEASNDWDTSAVLNTMVVAGNAGNPKRCRAVSGRVEVCNSKYGFNGWLGVASIWVNGSHITQGTVKVNDSYFSTPTYNSPEWRRLVMCQEIAHTLGLDHQDEDFSNPNLGTCMDYTNNPAGPLSNEHPNLHDYAELELIYNHLDSIVTVGQSITRKENSQEATEEAGLGNSIRRDKKGRASLYENNLGNGKKQLTFILWSE